MMDALSAALFHFLWQGALLALIPTLALMFPSARVRYAAACVAMLAMPVVFAVTFAVSMPETGMRFSLAPHLALPPAALPASSASLPQPFDFAQSMRWFVPFWMAGVALFNLRTLGSWMAVQRMRRASCVPAPAFWRRRIEELSARLGIRRAVALFGSSEVDVPVVAGFLRPAIFVPAALFAGMPVEQLEYLLIHELAHIRRFDYAVNLVQKAVEGLLFYHPAVWWVSRILRTERENCCDDAVVEMRGNAREYAAVLASLEQNRTAPALAASGGHLGGRIYRLLNRPNRFTAGPALGAIAITISATVAWAALQQPAAPQPPAAPLPAAAPAPAADAQPPVAPLPPAPPPPPPPPADRAKRLKLELAGPWRKWLNEDVAYIIEDQECAAFNALGSDAERERFVEQFWLRRDPTPGTPQNEFKEEHYRRIGYTNAHYSGDSLPGWKTDRGRIYITFGPPDEIDSHPSDASPFEEWRYKFIEGVGNDVVVRFVDKDHKGEFRMTTDPNGQPKRPPLVQLKPGGIVVALTLDPEKNFNVLARIETLNRRPVTTSEKTVRHEASLRMPFSLPPVATG
jgi:GWxTD domain-containing protein